MSGTLFIVCIPTSDKEEKFKYDDAKKNLNQPLKSVIEKKSSEFVVDVHKVVFCTFQILIYYHLSNFIKQGTQNNVEVCLAIENTDGSNNGLANTIWKSSSMLQKTKSCDNIITKENSLVSEDKILNISKH